MNGVLIIDKPAGMTSHDVVSRVRRVVQEKSVGHLGTLDPMATGVLPLVLGKLTRLAQFYLEAEKVYEGNIRFGFATDTYDAEGDPLPVSTGCEPGSAFEVNREEVMRVAERFRGVIEQVPPPFSAKKIQGVPAYKLARRKQDVALKPVEVEIKEFTILEVAGDTAGFRARVGSGTYIRSVANEMGQLLGCGAHLASLRRTEVAEFTLKDARTLEELQAAAEAGATGQMMLHLRRVLPAFPSVTAPTESASRMRSGQSVNLPEMSRARLVKVFEGQDELIAIASRVAGTLFHPKVVFAS